jgi:hypothetical protein
MYCRIAYQNYSKALFEDAGSYFQKSKIDPRFVIRLLSEHVGKSISPDDEAIIWQGAEADSASAEDSGSIGELLLAWPQNTASDVDWTGQSITS